MIAVNSFTAQAPLTQPGLTGIQILKLIPAPRVFVKTTPDSTSAAVVPSTKSNGNPATLTGWTDLGIVEGMVKVGYAKKATEVKTGIDNVLRAAYTSDKTGQCEFELAQVDDTVMAAITGLAASVVTAGSIYTFHMGQEDLTQLAMLLVVQSKLDGKEWQFYTPLCYMNFAFNDAKEGMSLKCTALLPFFTVSGQTNQDILSATIFK